MKVRTETEKRNLIKTIDLARENGTTLTAALKKHKVFGNQYYDWKKKFETKPMATVTFGTLNAKPAKLPEGVVFNLTDMNQPAIWVKDGKLHTSMDRRTWTTWAPQ